MTIEQDARPQLGDDTSKEEKLYRHIVTDRLIRKMIRDVSGIEYILTDTEYSPEFKEELMLERLYYADVTMNVLKQRFAKPAAKPFKVYLRARRNNNLDQKVYWCERLSVWTIDKDLATLFELPSEQSYVDVERLESAQHENIIDVEVVSIPD